MSASDSDSDTEIVSPGSKQPRAPKESNHYSWGSKIAESREVLEKLGVDVGPKKIESEQKEEPQFERQNSGSVWNKGGTWEERDVTNRAKSCLQDLLNDFELSESISITSIEKLEGEATLLFVRGTKRCGFEFEIELKWEGEVETSSGMETVKGKITFDEVSDSCGGDYDAQIQVSGSGEKVAIARREVQRGLEALKRQFGVFVERMKEQ